MWATEKNFLLDKIENSDYILAADADEVFHEDEFGLIDSAIQANIKSIAFNVSEKKINKALHANTFRKT